MNKIIIYSFYIFSVVHSLFGEKDNLLYLRCAQTMGMIAFFRVAFLSYTNRIDLRVIRSGNAFKICFLAIFATFGISLVNLRFNVFPIVYPVSFLSISILFLITNLKTNHFVYIALFVYALFLFYHLQGDPAGDWVKGSRNYVSVLALYLAMIPLIQSIINGEEKNLIVNIILPIGALIFSIIAIGRSGIVVSGIYLVGNLYLYFINHRLRGIMLPTISVIGVFVFNQAYPLMELVRFDYLYKFQTKGLILDARLDLITYYISLIDFRTLIFSTPDLQLRERMGMTLHNSYLSWHYQFGFFAFIILAITLKVCFFTVLRYKYLALLLVVILVRSFSDQILLTDGILFGLPFILSVTLAENYKLKRKK
ncbi:hypothetical protein N9292_02730 [Akkermansiaceae bacterium]|nr:hypothetical protein [Akkermansiaceae bacterium]MDB4424339.1 hypothetical protein [Akkermansiaceae bacterium]MDC0291564.1 hypothetical protein [Akkermansiaceae bacterium]